MQQGKFVYTIRAEIELTGQEIHLLTDAARSHYDAKCRNFFIRQTLFPFMGALWRQDFELLHGQSPETAPDKVVKVTVGTEELGRCRKIMENARHLGWPATLVNALHDGLARTFEALNVEFGRLNHDDDGVPTP